MQKNNIIGCITFKDSNGIIKKIDVARQFWIKHPDLASCVLYLRSLHITDFQVKTIEYTQI
jgi:trehalose-6-phosphate synthase